MTDLRAQVVDRSLGESVRRRVEVLTFAEGVSPSNADLLKTFCGPLGGSVVLRTKDKQGRLVAHVEPYTR